MLIRFHSRAAGDFSMFEDVAISLLKMMGHSGTVPGAILAEDIPQALQRLQDALALLPQQEVSESEGEEPAIGLSRRAYPLLQMLKASLAADCEVMWDH